MAVTVKEPAAVALPVPVVTTIAPLVAPGITIPTTLVLVPDMRMAATPPIVNAVGLVKLLPFMITKVPTAPLAGEKELIVGAWAADCKNDS